MWRHGDHSWEWTGLWWGHAGFTGPGALSGKAWGLFDGPYRTWPTAAAASYIPLVIVPHSQTKQNKSQFLPRWVLSLSQGSTGHPDWKPRSQLDLYPRILSSPSQAIHGILSHVTALVQVPVLSLFYNHHLPTGHLPL